jgi:hypothetical protein
MLDKLISRIFEWLGRFEKVDFFLSVIYVFCIIFAYFSFYLLAMVFVWKAIFWLLKL